MDLWQTGANAATPQIQTKYIAPAGQDLSNMPYNPYEPLEFQIRNSVAYSLWNLRPVEDTDDESYIDCFLLHSPLPTIDQTIQAWSILQTYVPDKIRTLGISHVSLPTLEALYQASTIKPTVVQNRFRPKTGYDVPLRAFCREHDISYQSFWTLTANAYSLLKSAPVMELANAVGVSTAVALYALIVDLGIVVLNGTTLSEHLREDLSGVAKVRDWAMDSEREWETMRVAFARLVGEPT
jgi:diketogulonate reductase-like aldo/keto reductase